MKAPLRVAWVTRSFLDYRIPVFAALDRLCQGQLHLFYSADYVPEHVQAAATDVLGERARGLRGEWRLGREDASAMANRNVSLRLQPGLNRLVRACDPDVVVGDGFFKWTAHGLLERWRHGTPLVICYERTAHTERHAQWWRRAYRRLVLRYTGAMACNGSLSKAYAVSLGMPADRITTGQMAADTPFFGRAAAAVGLDLVKDFRRQHQVEGLLYLHVGRLVPCKGCSMLLEAWADTVGRDGKATLMFVGTGEDEQALRRLCETKRLDSVRFVGAIPYGELPLVYAAADLLVSATREDNWSLVVPEAMACGLPVVCSTGNGCWPELVQPDVNGWVFDPERPEAFRAALRCCFAASGHLSAMGGASRRIVADFTPQAAASSILEACRLAIEYRQRGRS